MRRVSACGPTEARSGTTRLSVDPPIALAVLEDAEPRLPARSEADPERGTVDVLAVPVEGVRPPVPADVDVGIAARTPPPPSQITRSRSRSSHGSPVRAFGSVRKAIGLYMVSLFVGVESTGSERRYTGEYFLSRNVDPKGEEGGRRTGSRWWTTARGRRPRPRYSPRRATSAEAPIGRTARVRVPGPAARRRSAPRSGRDGGRGSPAPFGRCYGSS